jgi:hypothetical protein
MVLFWDGTAAEGWIWWVWIELLDVNGMWGWVKVMHGDGDRGESEFFQLWVFVILSLRSVS